MNVLSIPTDLQKRILEEKERVIVSSPDGKPIAALIPLEDLEYLQELEDERDVADALRAEHQAEKEGYITLDELLVENGMQRRRRRCTKSY